MANCNLVQTSFFPEYAPALHSLTILTKGRAFKTGLMNYIFVFRNKIDQIKIIILGKNYK